MQLTSTKGFSIIQNWLDAKGLSPFSFQQRTWQHILNGESGLVNAPTGCGKTFSVFLGAVIDFINRHPEDYKTKNKNGLQLLWITPLRALAKDIGRAMTEVIDELDMQWKIGIRNGDTDTNERQQQKRQMPEVLIITPESLHLLLAQKNYPEVFKSLKIIAIDEWHELIGSKRGVQVELALSRITGCRKFSAGNQESAEKKTALTTHGYRLTIWGISATIGNLQQAKDVLMAPLGLLDIEGPLNTVIVSANMQKKIEVESVFPEEIEKYPWAGHLGVKLVDKVIPIINNSRTTLIFINTRGMSEIWYQALLNAAPDLAGAIALHHG
ncbi:MAG: DEAD/DEAH box helicase, partial [Bacteroidetes bacterium]|nr:DEAD/DEAH box helicase [Bacteroidota bacterium]